MTASLEQRAQNLAQAIDGMVATALSLSPRRFKVPDILAGSYEFLQGENTPGKITLSSSQEADFHGHLFNLWISSRLYDKNNPETSSDLTFRPVRWTTVDLGSILGEASCTVTIGDDDNGDYQNSPMTIASLFSAAYGMSASGFGAVSNRQGPMTAYPSGLVFPVPYVIRAGKAATVSVSPTFSRATTSTTPRQYRVVAVMSGVKMARSA